MSIQSGYDIYHSTKMENIYIKWPQGSSICDQCADDYNNMLGYVSPYMLNLFHLHILAQYTGALLIKSNTVQ